MTTVINKVANRLREDNVVRVGFGWDAKPNDGTFACITTTLDRARWLISAARRQLMAEDLFFMSNNLPDIEYEKLPGIATHRRDGYVLGHWRESGQQRCTCDLA